MSPETAQMAAFVVVGLYTFVIGTCAGSVWTGRARARQEQEALAKRIADSEKSPLAPKRVVSIRMPCPCGVLHSANISLPYYIVVEQAENPTHKVSTDQNGNTVVVCPLPTVTATPIPLPPYDSEGCYITPEE
jgi:hypothetical protein